MITKSPIVLTDSAIASPNITGLFDKRDLDAIGIAVLNGCKIDEDSRITWTRRNNAAFNLALQLQESKTFPWPNAANVKFPLVTIAAIQWHSRAYPLLIQGNDLVKVRVPGPDPEGKKQARANRVGSFMSYQLLEESDTWEEETDRAFLQLPIVGCAFKKTYYASAKGQNVSELVAAKDLVINYWARSVESAQRKTHLIPYYRNDMHERVEMGTWRDIRDESWYDQPAVTTPAYSGQNDSQRRTGQTEPSSSDETTPFTFLEQHVRMDLDHDGYAEPYVILVEQNSGCVVRIFCNFEKKNVLYRNDARRHIIRIDSIEWFTKYSFIPSPDGGIYDVGFGTLLGPVNQAVDSLINQLLDAGTLATTAGGFLGRGVKIRGGEYSFRPFGWQRVDSSGEDLAKGIYPFPIREPSAVLFNLLGLLVDYTNRVSGSTDIMVGENPGQNTPATTSQLMAEQGAKINSAIFKRVWRSMKTEFQKLYLLNSRNIPVTVLRFGEADGWVNREDFLGPEEAIRPAADPNLASDGARVQQAMMIKQNAATTPGYDLNVVELNLLRAMKVEGIESLFKGVESTPPPKDPRIAVEELKQAGKKEIQSAALQVKVAEKLLDLKAGRDEIAARIELLKAQSAEILSEIGAKKATHELATFEAQINALKAIDESYRAYAELSQQGSKDGNGSQQGGSGGMAPPPGDTGGIQLPPAADQGGLAQLVGGSISPPGAA